MKIKHIKAQVLLGFQCAAENVKAPLFIAALHHPEVKNEKITTAHNV